MFPRLDCKVPRHRVLLGNVSSCKQNKQLKYVKLLFVYVRTTRKETGFEVEIFQWMKSVARGTAFIIFHTVFVSVVWLYKTLPTLFASCSGIRKPLGAWGPALTTWWDREHVRQLHRTERVSFRNRRFPVPKVQETLGKWYLKKRALRVLIMSWVLKSMVLRFTENHQII